MRTFYIYSINDLYTSIYDIYPHKLYKMLEEAYHINKHNLVLASDYYEQMITTFNKLYVNNYLIANNRLNSYYFNKNNVHLISNSREYSKLMITSTCLKLKTNLNYSSFFENLKVYNDNIFICDFVNGDYFWLNKIKNFEKNLC